MRCRTKLDFAETYRFGHNSCNSGPFLLKMCLKCANFKGYYFAQPVAIGLNRSGCVVWKACNHNHRSSPVQFLVFFRLHGPDLQTLGIVYGHLTWRFVNSSNHCKIEKKTCRSDLQVGHSALHFVRFILGETLLARNAGCHPIWALSASKLTYCKDC